MLTIVRTPEDEYYGEFHGADLPEEVVFGDECIASL
jgi:hypothetical protein